MPQDKDTKQTDDAVDRARSAGIDLSEAKIVNEEAYQKFLEAANDPILSTHKMYKASDGNLYSLGQISDYLRKNVAHLPKDEIERIMEMKKQFHKVVGRMNVYKRMAFNSDSLSQEITKVKTTKSILDSKKAELIELFGRMFTYEEVHRIAIKEWHIPCSISNIKDFKKKYIQTIEAKIEEHKRTFSDIRLGIKRSRLEEYCWIFAQSKQRYEITKSREDLKVMMTALEKIKGEVEVDVLRIEGNIHMDIETSVKGHLHAEVLKDLSLRQIIIGRIASKMNVNPVLLVSRLTSSYYNKYAGFDTEETEFEDIQYPSEEPYDFDKMKRNNEEIVKSEKEIVEQSRADEYKKGEDAKKSGLKNELLTMIKARKESIKNVTNQIQVEELNRDTERTKEAAEDRKKLTITTLQQASAKSARDIHSRRAKERKKKNAKNRENKKIEKAMAEAKQKSKTKKK